MNKSVNLPVSGALSRLSEEDRIIFQPLLDKLNRLIEVEN